MDFPDPQIAYRARQCFPATHRRGRLGPSESDQEMSEDTEHGDADGTFSNGTDDFSSDDPPFSRSCTTVITSVTRAETHSCSSGQRAMFVGSGLGGGERIDDGPSLDVFFTYLNKVLNSIMPTLILLLSFFLDVFDAAILDESVCPGSCTVPLVLASIQGSYQHIPLMRGVSPLGSSSTGGCTLSMPPISSPSGFQFITLTRGTPTTVKPYVPSCLPQSGVQVSPLPFHFSDGGFRPVQFVSALFP